MAKETPPTKSLKRKSPPPSAGKLKEKQKKSSPNNKIKRRRGNPPHNATSANLVPLGSNSFLAENTNKKKKKKVKEQEENRKSDIEKNILLSTLPSSQQLRYFLGLFEKANGLKLSPIEIKAFRDSCIVELSDSVGQDVENISQHVKSVFGEPWKEVLCEGELSDGSVQEGSPAILVISGSALRSLELLRGLKELTRKCRPAKLFAKHMKVEEQVSLLKGRVNIASGTPSRIKKLIDIDALQLSRLEIIILDMQQDAKGYSLFTLPQVSREFWDLYKAHFQTRILEVSTRICFYGPTAVSEIKKVIQNVD